MKYILALLAVAMMAGCGEQERNHAHVQRDPHAIYIPRIPYDIQIDRYSYCFNCHCVLIYEDEHGNTFRWQENP